MAIEIPEALQGLASAVVKKSFRKNLPKPDLTPLQDWFEAAGWDEVVMSEQGGCVDLHNISSNWFDDENVDLEEGEEKITDKMRLAFARERIDFELDNYEVAVHAVELKVPDLPPVFLECVITTQEPGGWKVEWGRVFKTVDELLASYDEMLIMESTAVSDSKILKLWRANERALKKWHRLINTK